MAATDVLYRKQSTLNWVFAASSLIMLVTVVWMFADDFNRPYKKDQRVFRTVEEELNRRAVLALAPSEAQEKEIVASEAAVVKARDLVKQVRKQADAAVKSMLPEKVKLDTSVQNIKADYDAAVSYFNIAVEKDGPGGSDAKKHRKTFEDLWVELEAKRAQVEKHNEKIMQAELAEYDVEGKKTSLPAAEKSLKDLEAKHKRLTGDFDRFLKQTVLKTWGVADSIRSMPVLDGFASPVKIKQSFHDDLPIDYGGFKYVTRYDRCTTCHLGIDKLGNDKATLTRLTMDPLQDEKLQMECKNAQRVLEERQKTNKDGNQDINQLAARDLQPRQVKLNSGQIASFAAHPRLDLFVGANSPHGMEKFGCTICHAGQGSATGFVDAVHTPNDAETMARWKREHDWQSIHFWDFPMLPSRFIESSCVKCHHQVESLIRNGDRNEAPKLVKGFNLVRELGCFGCHEIQGMKGGRSIGPDMRLEPDPPLVSLTPEERAKRLADTANPPGTFRKVGPSLYRIAEKTNEEWTAKWIKAPRAFRPDTKMPHFYMQANNVPDVLPEDQKKFADLEVRAMTHYLFGKSDYHLKEISAAAKRTPEQVQADEKLVADLTLLLAKGDDVPEGERKDAIKKLNEARARNAAGGLPLPVAERVMLPAAPSDEAGKVAQRDRGRSLLATKGCMACHQHDTLASAAQTADGKPLPALVGESNFGPNLSFVAAKLGQQNQSEGARKWLVQWLLDPMVHSPRTLMPVTHLTANEADDVAAWLLSQNPAPSAEWASVSVEPADSTTLKAMIRIYLRKAGLVTKEVEEVLNEGFSKEKLQYRAEDADERELSAPLDDKKMLTYIGKKAIGNQGCFGCHNIPGFEGAKPIGVGLNDWGKKDVDRIAYEDADNYVKQHYHIIDGWNDKDEHKHDHDAHGDKHGQPLEKFAPYPITSETPYEKYFADMMHHGHRQREGFLHLKLMSPRAYDFNRVRDWNDRARMPQFKFARSVKRPDESAEDFQKRQAHEEAEGREAVMTFILGLIAEPIPPKFVHQPTPERAAEIAGRRVLDQFNCNSCHLIRPGMFELMLTDDIVNDKDGKPVMIEVTEGEKTKQVPLTYRKAVMDRLTLVHQAYRADEDGDPKERIFREHSAWNGAKPPVAGADRMTAFGVLGLSTTDADGTIGPSLRLSNALSFIDADGAVKTIPANTPFGVPFLAGPMRELAPTFGGTFALKLKEYLSAANPAVYGDQAPYGKIDDSAGQALNGYAALPPPLFHQGERVQPAWLYQFLLNPKPIRKIPPLQMPKFSLSDTDAMNLVNYFTAVNQLGNPATGLEGPYAKVPQRDEQYLLARTKEYVARLKANNWFDNRVQEMKPIWARVAKENLEAAEQKLAAAKAANETAKVQEAQKEVDTLKSQIGANDFPAQKARWEEREAYIADAWKLVTYSGNLCITCHQVGPALPNEYRAPNLENAWERLRPDWTERWIAYPQRLTPFASLMQPQYKPADAKKHSEEAKVFAGTPDDQIRASRDLLMMFNQVVDWPVIKFRAGVNAFGPPATPPKP